MLCIPSARCNYGLTKQEVPSGGLPFRVVAKSVGPRCIDASDFALGQVLAGNGEQYRARFDHILHRLPGRENFQDEAVECATAFRPGARVKCCVDPVLHQVGVAHTGRERRISRIGRAVQGGARLSKSHQSLHAEKRRLRPAETLTNWPKCYRQKLRATTKNFDPCGNARVFLYQYGGGGGAFGSGPSMSARLRNTLRSIRE